MILDIAAGLVENATIGNVVNGVDFLSFLPGDWSLIIWAIVLIAAAFIFVWVFKQVIANTIAGIIAYVIFVFLLGINIPLNPLTVLVTVLGGLGGVAALLIAVFFNWL